MAIERYLNIDDDAQLLVVLYVLDMLVVNCGYPMQLEISQKEFLNKLVYRFPQHPVGVIYKEQFRSCMLECH